MGIKCYETVLKRTPLGIDGEPRQIDFTTPFFYSSSDMRVYKAINHELGEHARLRCSTCTH